MALRSGRDDKVGVAAGRKLSVAPVPPLSSRPERSAVEGPAVHSISNQFTR